MMQRSPLLPLVQDVIERFEAARPMLDRLAADFERARPLMEQGAADIQRLRSMGLFDRLPSHFAAAQRLIVNLPPLPSFLLED